MRTFAPHRPDFRIYPPWDEHCPAGALALTRLSHTRQILKNTLSTQIQVLAPARSANPRLHTSNPSSLNQPIRHRLTLDDDNALHLVAAPSREGKVRWAFKAIKCLLSTGTAPNQIALLSPNPQLPLCLYALVVLKLEAVNDPTEGFDNIQRGILLHAVLENLFRQLASSEIARTTTKTKIKQTVKC